MPCKGYGYDGMLVLVSASANTLNIEVDEGIINALESEPQLAFGVFAFALAKVRHSKHLL